MEDSEQGVDLIHSKIINSYTNTIVVTNTLIVADFIVTTGRFGSGDGGKAGFIVNPIVAAIVVMGWTIRIKDDLVVAWDKGMMSPWCDKASS